MNRRHFLHAASGLLVAASAGLLLPERRVWAVDRTMVCGQVPMPNGLLIRQVVEWCDAIMPEHGDGRIWMAQNRWYYPDRPEEIYMPFGAVFLIPPRGM